MIFHKEYMRYRREELKLRRICEAFRDVYPYSLKMDKYSIFYREVSEALSKIYFGYRDKEENQEYYDMMMDRAWNKI